MTGPPRAALWTAATGATIAQIGQVSPVGGVVIPGWSEGPDPESRDSGSGPSDHPGMTEAAGQPRTRAATFCSAPASRSPATAPPNPSRGSNLAQSAATRGP